MRIWDSRADLSNLIFRQFMPVFNFVRNTKRASSCRQRNGSSFISTVPNGLGPHRRTWTYKGFACLLNFSPSKLLLLLLFLPSATLVIIRRWTYFKWSYNLNEAYGTITKMQNWMRAVVSSKYGEGSVNHLKLIFNSNINLESYFLIQLTHNAVFSCVANNSLHCTSQSLWQPQLSFYLFPIYLIT